jgi:hypothetical protein
VLAGEVLEGQELRPKTCGYTSEGYLKANDGMQRATFVISEQRVKAETLLKE